MTVGLEIELNLPESFCDDPYMLGRKIDPLVVAKLPYVSFAPDQAYKLPEFSFGPSWSVSTQIYLWQKFRDGLGLIDDEVHSVQVNLGIPSTKFRQCAKGNLLKDMRLLMLAVVLAFVSDQRIVNKKTAKVIQLDDKIKFVNGKRYIRIEYGFADIANLFEISYVLQRLHAAIVEYHSVFRPLKYDDLTINSNFPLAAVWQENGILELKPFLLEYLLSKKLGIDLRRADTFYKFISWRQIYSDYVGQLRDLLISTAEACDQVIGNSTIIKTSSPVSKIDLKPSIVVLDVHGTVFEPTWKLEVADIAQGLRPWSRRVALAWVAIIAHLSSQKINEQLFLLGKGQKTLAEINSWRKERSHYYHSQGYSPGLKTYVREFIKALYGRDILIFIRSGAPQDQVLWQLAQTGLLDAYISRDYVLAGEKKKGITPADTLRGIHVQYPFSRMIYFDDWIGGGTFLKTIDALYFGLPQGPSLYGKEFQFNKSILVKDGVDYLLHGWRDYQRILEMILASHAEQHEEKRIPIAQGPAQEVHGIVPAQRPNKITLHIDVDKDLNVTYSKVADDSRVSSLDGKANYDNLVLKKIVTIKNVRLITPQKYIDQCLPSKQRDALNVLLRQNRRYTRYGGVTVSWDMDVDKDVWTTNIDTVFLICAAIKLGIFKNKNIKKFLEVGTGGGHIAAFSARELFDIFESLTVTDISIYALRCAAKNILAYASPKLKIHFYLGRGIKSIDDFFDAIFINPPYLPVPAWQGRDACDENDPYRGLDLVREIVSDGVKKLNPDNPQALLVINISHLAEKALRDFVAEQKGAFVLEDLGFDRKVPFKYEGVPTDLTQEEIAFLIQQVPETLQVPLKIVAVDEAWRQWLVKEHGLEYRPDAGAGEEPYWHTLKVFVMRRASSSSLRYSYSDAFMKAWDLRSERERNDVFVVTEIFYPGFQNSLSGLLYSADVYSTDSIKNHLTYMGIAFECEILRKQQLAIVDLAREIARKTCLPYQLYQQKKDEKKIKEKAKAIMALRQEHLFTIKDFQRKIFLVAPDHVFLNDFARLIYEQTEDFFDKFGVLARTQGLEGFWFDFNARWQKGAKRRTDIKSWVDTKVAGDSSQKTLSSPVNALPKTNEEGLYEDLLCWHGISDALPEDPRAIRAAKKDAEEEFNGVSGEGKTLFSKKDSQNIAESVSFREVKESIKKKFPKNPLGRLAQQIHGRMINKGTSRFAGNDFDCFPLKPTFMCRCIVDDDFLSVFFVGRAKTYPFCLVESIDPIFKIQWKAQGNKPEVATDKQESLGDLLRGISFVALRAQDHFYALQGREGQESEEILYYFVDLRFYDLRCSINSMLSLSDVDMPVSWVFESAQSFKDEFISCAQRKIRSFRPIFERELERLYNLTGEEIIEISKEAFSLYVGREGCYHAQLFKGFLFPNGQRSQRQYIGCFQADQMGLIIDKDRVSWQPTRITFVFYKKDVTLGNFVEIGRQSFVMTDGIWQKEIKEKRRVRQEINKIIIEAYQKRSRTRNIESLTETTVDLSSGYMSLNDLKEGFAPKGLPFPDGTITSHNYRLGIGVNVRICQLTIKPTEQGIDYVFDVTRTWEAGITREVRESFRLSYQLKAYQKYIFKSKEKHSFRYSLEEAKKDLPGVLRDVRNRPIHEECCLQFFIKHLLERWGWNFKDLATALDVSFYSVRKWAHAEVLILDPNMVQIWKKVFDLNPLSLDDLNSINNNIWMPPNPMTLRALFRRMSLTVVNRQHLKRDVNRARQLLPREDLSAPDVSVCIMALWLHDVTKDLPWTRYIPENQVMSKVLRLLVHPQESADVAKDFLRDQGYPDWFNKKVCDAIIKHMGPIAGGHGNLGFMENFRQTNWQKVFDALKDSSVDFQRKKQLLTYLQAIKEKHLQPDDKSPEDMLARLTRDMDLLDLASIEGVLKIIHDRQNSSAFFIDGMPESIDQSFESALQSAREVFLDLYTETAKKEHHRLKDVLLNKKEAIVSQAVSQAQEVDTDRVVKGDKTTASSSVNTERRGSGSVFSSAILPAMLVLSLISLSAAAWLGISEVSTIDHAGFFDPVTLQWLAGFWSDHVLTLLSGVFPNGPGEIFCFVRQFFDSAESPSLVSFLSYCSVIAVSILSGLFYIFRQQRFATFQDKSSYQTQDQLDLSEGREGPYIFFSLIQPSTKFIKHDHFVYRTFDRDFLFTIRVFNRVTAFLRHTQKIFLIDVVDLKRQKHVGYLDAVFDLTTGVVTIDKAYSDYRFLKNYENSLRSIQEAGYPIDLEKSDVKKRKSFFSPRGELSYPPGIRLSKHYRNSKTDQRYQLANKLYDLICQIAKENKMSFLEIIPLPELVQSRYYQTRIPLPNTTRRTRDFRKRIIFDLTNCPAPLFSDLDSKGHEEINISAKEDDSLPRFNCVTPDGRRFNSKLLRNLFIIFSLASFFVFRVSALWVLQNGFNEVVAFATLPFLFVSPTDFFAIELKDYDGSPPQVQTIATKLRNALLQTGRPFVQKKEVEALPWDEIANRIREHEGPVMTWLIFGGLFRACIKDTIKEIIDLSVGLTGQKTTRIILPLFAMNHSYRFTFTSDLSEFRDYQRVDQIPGLIAEHSKDGLITTGEEPSLNADGYYFSIRDGAGQCQVVIRQDGKTFPVVLSEAPLAKHPEVVLDFVMSPEFLEPVLRQGHFRASSAFQVKEITNSFNRLTLNQEDRLCISSSLKTELSEELPLAVVWRDGNFCLDPYSEQKAREQLMTMAANKLMEALQSWSREEISNFLRDLLIAYVRDVDVVSFFRLVRDDKVLSNSMAFVIERHEFNRAPYCRGSLCVSVAALKRLSEQDLARLIGQNALSLFLFILRGKKEPSEDEIKEEEYLKKVYRDSLKQFGFGKKEKSGGIQPKTDKGVRRLFNEKDILKYLSHIYESWTDPKADRRVNSVINRLLHRVDYYIDYDMYVEAVSLWRQGIQIGMRLKDNVPFQNGEMTWMLRKGCELAYLFRNFLQNHTVLQDETNCWKFYLEMSLGLLKTFWDFVDIIPSLKVNGESQEDVDGEVDVLCIEKRNELFVEHFKRALTLVNNLMYSFATWVVNRKCVDEDFELWNMEKMQELSLYTAEKLCRHQGALPEEVMVLIAPIMNRQKVFLERTLEKLAQMDSFSSQKGLYLERMQPFIAISFEMLNSFDVKEKEKLYQNLFYNLNNFFRELREFYENLQEGEEKQRYRQHLESVAQKIFAMMSRPVFIKQNPTTKVKLALTVNVIFNILTKAYLELSKNAKVLELCKFAFLGLKEYRAQKYPRSFSEQASITFQQAAHVWSRTGDYQEDGLGSAQDYLREVIFFVLEDESQNKVCFSQEQLQFLEGLKNEIEFQDPSLKEYPYRMEILKKVRELFGYAVGP
ncbi:MAG: methyltransferase [Candidatus Omnitrophica bacterium]|nr:methyltransferase [Candidatus Omnitrophota bacterium]